MAKTRRPESERVSRRAFLARSAGLAGSAAAWACGGGASSPSAASPASASPAPTASLAAHARARGRVYGAAAESDRLTRDSPFAAAVARECGILVPEVSLKWAALRPAADRFDFRAADALRDFARQNGMAFRGHTLLWHQSLPSWFSSTVNAGNAERFLVEHVQAVAGRYAGQMHSWDVVNEALDPASGRSDGLRVTPWLTYLGPRYIELAFRTAAAADPTALLCYNDYGLEPTTAGSKRESTIRLLSDLLGRGVPVHALGIQGHVGGTGQRQFSAADLTAFLRRVAGLGLRIVVSELDVKDDNLPADIAQRDAQVAAIYRDFLSAALAEPAVIGVLTWGLSDRYTWLSTAAPRSDGLAVRPLPLDANLERKLAWEAIATALDA